MKQSIQSNPIDQPPQIIDKRDASKPQLANSVPTVIVNDVEILHCAACGEKITPEMASIIKNGQECFCEFCGQPIRVPE